MKQIRTLYLLLTAIIVLAACSKTDDTSVTLYSDSAITGFTLGTLKRTVDGTTKTYSASSYKFTIDQITRTVYNADSLPVGTDPTAILCTISTLNNGVPMLIDTDGQTMSYHSSSVTVDFTTERDFRVYASDGSGYTTYKIKVNIHKENGDEFVWKLMDDALVPTADDLPAGIKQLLGQSTTEKYGLSTENKLMVLHKEGDTWKTEWEPDIIDEDESTDLLPTEDVSLVSYPMNYSDSTDYVLMAGKSSANSTRSMVWRKIVDYSKNAPIAQWSLIERDDDDKYNLPLLERLTLIRYDESILAFGGDYTTIYQSRDNGITWKTNSLFKMPENFDYSATDVNIYSDKENFIWLVNLKTGQIWRGRLNRLGWK